MFVIKYHAKGKRTKYFSGGKSLVVNKRYAIAFGDNLMEKFKALENEYCTLEKIKVSDVAERMYENTYVKYGKIIW